ncbi:PepSY-like domain-containing protein [Spirosoma flavum]|uniref:PepSY-like domain-containing protein n=1 Tax=Spirosoma flavum TaxID=2048557 RepID=A0ABW6AKN6_9BACT
MKTLLVLSCLAALVVSLNACNNNSVDPTTADAAARSGGVVSTSLTGPHSLTAVNVTSLPAAITTYISTNYAGATVKEALKDAKGDYVVAITVNSVVKLLLFKADGTFVKEADIKAGHAPGDSAKHHMPGDSAKHHMPGDSANHPKPSVGDSAHHPRPGQGPDLTTVAVSSLPAAITSYISTNYAGATIDKASQEKKSTDYVVVITTSDKKHVLLLFGSDGTFKKAFAGK